MIKAKDFLTKYRFFRQKLRTEKMHLQGIISDTYGLDLPVPQEDRVQKTPASADDILITKIVKMEKDLESALKKTDRYIELCDFIITTCTNCLNDKELLVLQEIYFSDRYYTYEQVAFKLKFSPAWVQKWIISAYKTLDQELMVLEKEKKIPLELY